MRALITDMETWSAAACAAVNLICEHREVYLLCVRETNSNDTAG